jgi:threonine dehydrogenase-like Zn-dependent dehydrogenase
MHGDSQPFVKLIGDICSQDVGAAMLAVVKNPAEAGISLQDVPLPEFSPWEVLLKVKAVGICGSDMRMFKYADAGRRGNYVLGHELSGDIVAMGEKVHGFEKADRVAAEICIGCAICRYCRKGLVNLCENLNEIGVTMNGGMAEFVAVPARNIHRIPDGLSYEVATFADPLACSIRGLESAGIEPGSWVAILGPGTIGLLAKNKIDVNPLIGQSFPLKEAEKAFEFCFARKGVKTLLTP